MREGLRLFKQEQLGFWYIYLIVFVAGMVGIYFIVYCCLFGDDIDGHEKIQQENKKPEKMEEQKKDEDMMIEKMEPKGEKN